MCETAAGSPGPPAGLRVTTVSAVTAVVSWQASVEHGTPVTGYQLEHWEENMDSGVQDARRQVLV